MLVKSGLWLQQEARSLSGSDSAAQLTREFRRMGLELVRAQSRMAPILNLVNRVLELCDQAGSGQELLQSVGNAIDQILDNTRSAKPEIAKHLSATLATDMIIVTYSRSSVVISALRELANRPSFRVVLMESRPVMEGRTAAKQLTEAGVSVTLMVDAAMATAVEQADIVITGADAFDDNFFINKIGTHPLGLLCREYRKSLFVLASSNKYLPDIRILPPEPSKPMQEVWPDLADDNKIKIDNHYFESIPLSLVRGVVTEGGVWRPGEKAFDPEFRANPWLWEQLMQH